ncbi:MAG: hypothetical protein GYA33_12620 [Thermogutta sp.]|nr:hypothetical protein [Thermogutta sp.]
MGGQSSLMTSEAADIQHWLNELLGGEDELSAAVLETFERLEDALQRWRETEEAENARRRQEAAHQQSLIESLQRERRWVEERREEIRHQEEALARQIADLAAARKEWEEKARSFQEARESVQGSDTQGVLRLQEQLAALREKLDSVSGDFKESLSAELLGRLHELRHDWLDAAATPSPLALPPELTETLAALREKLDSRPDSDATPAEIRGLLQDAIARLEGRIQALGDSAAVSAQERTAALEEEVRNLQTQLTTAEQERTNLETELEFVRHRAGELLEMLAEQRRQMAEERATWWAELKRLRRLMEVLLDHQLETPGGYQSDVRPDGVQPRVVGYEDVEPLNRTGTEDAALDSVSQQFELLQRDFSRRRRSDRE